jgi:hypothetical protein
MALEGVLGRGDGGGICVFECIGVLDDESVLWGVDRGGAVYRVFGFDWVFGICVDGYVSPILS